VLLPKAREKYGREPHLMQFDQRAKRLTGGSARNLPVLLNENPAVFWSSSALDRRRKMRRTSKDARRIHPPTNRDSLGHRLEIRTGARSRLREPLLAPIRKTADSTHCPPLHPAPNHYFSSGWKFKRLQVARSADIMTRWTLVHCCQQISNRDAIALAGADSLQKARVYGLIKRQESRKNFPRDEMLSRFVQPRKVSTSPRPPIAKRQP